MMFEIIVDTVQYFSVQIKCKVNGTLTSSQFNAIVSSSTKNSAACEVWVDHFNNDSLIY